MDRDTLIADVESRGKALEAAFGADSCRNVDRIARLPGTINWPCYKKQQKGRKPCLAVVLDFTPDRTYQIDLFPPHKEVQTKPKDITPVVIEGAKRLDNIGELDEWNVPDRIKVIIVQGDHPEEQKEIDNSRSIWLFDAVCGLVRCGVPNNVIYSIITDAKWGVSDSVLDKGSGTNDYAIRQIKRAHQAVSTNAIGEWDKTDKGGNPKTSYNNTRVAIQRLGITCEYDTFHNRYNIGGHELQNHQGELDDHACTMLRQLIYDKYRFDPQKTNVADAALQLCLTNKVDPVKDYLDSLSWDGVERLDNFLHRYFGTEQTRLNTSIGRIMLIAAVRRIKNPGSKFDTMVVLEGKQGTGKSTALVILAGQENFSDQDILALDAKSQMEALEGVWVYEVSELEGMSKSEVGKVKAFISRQEDKARPAYARFRENRARRCIFVGTTNEDQYLRDRTGNRRFLPVQTGQIDLAALRQDRDQLWAEAVTAEAAGEGVVLPEELWQAAAQQQLERVEYDPWIEVLAGTTGETVGDMQRIFTAEVLELLGVPPERWYPATYKRLGHAMRELGWEGPKTIRDKDGNVQKGYEKPTEEAVPQLSAEEVLAPLPKSSAKN